VGCGDGSLAAALAEAGARVTALDAEARMLAAARAQVTDGIAFVRGDALHLPFADETFDRVTAVALLCFVPDARAAVAEMARVLRPGGRLVIGELGRFNLWSAVRRVRGWLGSSVWRRARFRTGRELRALVEAAGLSAERACGAIFYPPHRWCAQLLSPLDRRIGRRTSAGAAFVAIAAVRP
jgi:ubiquinone/menaquinone biosynthesis C-methylase UbiE